MRWKIYFKLGLAIFSAGHEMHIKRVEKSSDAENVEWMWLRVSIHQIWRSVKVIGGHPKTNGLSLLCWLETWWVALVESSSAVQFKVSRDRGQFLNIIMWILDILFYKHYPDQFMLNAKAENVLNIK